MERGKYLGQMIVATRPCGCAQGWMWRDKDCKPKEIVKTTGQWIADGCFVEELARYENDGQMERHPVKCGVHAGTHTDWVSSVDEKPVRNGPYEVAPLNHWLHGREPKPILPTNQFSFYGVMYDKWGKIKDKPSNEPDGYAQVQEFWWRGLTEAEYQRRIILKNTQTAPVAEGV